MGRLRPNNTPVIRPNNTPGAVNDDSGCDDDDPGSVAISSDLGVIILSLVVAPFGMVTFIPNLVVINDKYVVTPPGQVATTLGAVNDDLVCDD